PGGNVTGLSMLDTEIAAKRVELAKELFPTLRRPAVLWDSNGPVRLEAVAKAARTLGIELQSLSAAAPEEFEPAFDAAKKANADAMIIMPSAFFVTQRRKLIALAAQKRLPVIYEHRQFTAVGGLISYGPDITEMYRGAARYVDRILKGAKPADLPVEQASKHELVINRRTAAALGVKIPGALLVRAD